MQIDELQAYCESKKAVITSFPFDQNTLVFKVMDKIFCLSNLKNWEQGVPSVNLKCDPDQAIELREMYPETVTSGYHAHKKHWNTIRINHDLPDIEITQWIDHSYNLIVAKLSRKDGKLFNDL
jgi:predicted DNA-binding protein (MmcQ/YjbR family)